MAAITKVCCCHRANGQAAYKLLAARYCQSTVEAGCTLHLVLFLCVFLYHSTLSTACMCTCSQNWAYPKWQSTLSKTNRDYCVTLSWPILDIKVLWQKATETTASFSWPILDVKVLWQKATETTASHWVGPSLMSKYFDRKQQRLLHHWVSPLHLHSLPYLSTRDVIQSCQESMASLRGNIQARFITRGPNVILKWD